MLDEEKKEKTTTGRIEKMSQLINTKCEKGGRAAGQGKRLKNSFIQNLKFCIT